MSQHYPGTDSYRGSFRISPGTLVESMNNFDHLPQQMPASDITPHSFGSSAPHSSSATPEPALLRSHTFSQLCLTLGAPTSSSGERRKVRLGYHRTSVACEHCRKRKIRCVVSSDSHNKCDSCVRLRRRCSFEDEAQMASPLEVKAEQESPVSTEASPGVLEASPYPHSIYQEASPSNGRQRHPEAYLPRGHQTMPGASLPSRRQTLPEVSVPHNHQIHPEAYLPRNHHTMPGASSDPFHPSSLPTPSSLEDWLLGLDQQVTLEDLDWGNFPLTAQQPQRPMDPHGPTGAVAPMMSPDPSHADPGGFWMPSMTTGSAPTVGGSQPMSPSDVWPDHQRQMAWQQRDRGGVSYAMRGGGYGEGYY